MYGDSAPALGGSCACRLPTLPFDLAGTTRKQCLLAISASRYWARLRSNINISWRAVKCGDECARQSQVSDESAPSINRGGADAGMNAVLPVDDSWWRPRSQDHATIAATLMASACDFVKHLIFIIFTLSDSASALDQGARESDRARPRAQSGRQPAALAAGARPRCARGRARSKDARRQQGASHAYGQGRRGSP